MRTTIDLPEPLVREAMAVSHQRTKTAVIISALEEYVRRGKMRKLKQYRGKVPVDIDLDTLRNRS